jgi:uncharacterized protein involved in tolerance to divalent cations
LLISWGRARTTVAQEQDAARIAEVLVRDKLAACVTAIRRIHPYELPEIIVLPVVGGLAEYMNWIDVESREWTRVGALAQSHSVSAIPAKRLVG